MSDRRKELHEKVCDTVIIKKCHVCGHLTESRKEIDKCLKCQKAFLPLKYFIKIHEQRDGEKYEELFSHCTELNEEDLVIGLYVLW
jgi:hypothetical protein